MEGEISPWQLNEGGSVQKSRTLIVAQGSKQSNLTWRPWAASEGLRFIP